MTRKRWLLLGLLSLGIVAAVLTVLALLPPRPGVTKANFDRVEIGMNRAQVEAIFDGPADPEYPEEWENEAFDIAKIGFDKEGRVKSKDWDAWPDERTLLQKTLDRLPWREDNRPVRIRVRATY
jgi:hypothetical protein